MQVQPGIVAGTAHCLQLAPSGEVHAWGKNHRGQLGVASEASSVDVPQRVTDLPAIGRVRAGNAHSIALGTDGRVYAFGDNRHGQLGSPQPSFTSKPQLVALPGPVADIASGGAHTLALSTAGEVWAWGSNEEAQLGLNDVRVAAQPVRIVTNARARAIAARGAYSAILLADGSVHVRGGGRRSHHCCWPEAHSLKLADGTGLLLQGPADAVVHSIPVPVVSASRICRSVERPT